MAKKKQKKKEKRAFAKRIDKALSAKVLAVYTTMISVGGLFFPATYIISDAEGPTPTYVDGILLIVPWRSIELGNPTLIGMELLLIALVTVVLLVFLVLERIRSVFWPILGFFLWVVGFFFLGARVGGSDTINVNIDTAFESYLAWSVFVYAAFLFFKGFAHLAAKQDPSYRN